MRRSANDRFLDRNTVTRTELQHDVRVIAADTATHGAYNSVQLFPILAVFRLENHRHIGEQDGNARHIQTTRRCIRLAHMNIYDEMRRRKERVISILYSFEQELFAVRAEHVRVAHTATAAGAGDGIVRACSTGANIVRAYVVIGFASTRARRRIVRARRSRTNVGRAR